jgi:hypothetical protein
VIAYIGYKDVKRETIAQRNEKGVNSFFNKIPSPKQTLVLLHGSTHAIVLSTYSFIAGAFPALILVT